jgi:hypothetical protein
MALHLETSIDIDVAPEAVWAVLSDLPSYPSWNPFIREASGTLAAGERLDIELQPTRGRAMRFRPTVLAAEPNSELRWLGRLVVRGCSTASTASRSCPSSPGVSVAARCPASSG